MVNIDDIPYLDLVCVMQRPLDRNTNEGVVFWVCVRDSLEGFIILAVILALTKYTHACREDTKEYTKRKWGVSIIVVHGFTSCADDRWSRFGWA